MIGKGTLIALLSLAFFVQSLSATHFSCCGHWRTDVTVGKGTPSGSIDRTDDWLLTGHLEYEFPLLSHLAMGLRLLPLLVYHPHRHQDVFGAGFGIVFRAYWCRCKFVGPYFEIHSNLFTHQPEFRGNTSHQNFLSGAGFGFQLPNNWHATGKWEHISNAGMGRRNSGVNTVGVAIGYSFPPCL